ncbi:uncharacterized protein LOC122256522 isoform X2 [Penaeus japonicus]|nr:uncharacterized protein LOC122256522 isoform X2 [Penaeus japonicus]XP_042877211.1 uncharacterized protein LOC122256522 isoform X2 [Penaeus japonicus]XP_042877212.1 uncharacterized protein LOC122256522 isoform X2 [Penaeus japonicus]XP_042877213.1 uncharacterized protein LOC122256522 isoform X2 [Penaeus japonicus]XP_042877214.1 uncharacterized protein LOC122256522 isoform X2 [Penaeus japonicus]XP_042877215.1 uncharacterized protein LOC122256522 isoform X2 [Penaeus japonicus]
MMASHCSPTSLQQACEVAAAAWLVQWSRLVGQVTTRASAPYRQPHIHREPAISPRVQGGSKCPTSTPVSSDTPRACRCRTQKTVSGLHVQKGETRSPRTSGRGKASRTTTVLQYEEPHNVHNAPNHGISEEAVKLLPSNAQPFTNGSCSVDRPSPRSTPALSFPTLMKTTTSTDLCKDIYNNIVRENVTQCSSFFKSHLPPLLINQILSTAWRLMSQQVALGGRLEAVPEYQVVDWALQAPVLLRMAGALTHRSFPLDLSGVPETCLDVVMAEINEKLPPDQVNKLVLPKAKFKSCKPVVLDCQGILLQFLKKTNLASLTLHSELCDNSALETISTLSLQELDIGSSSVTEEGIINKLCGLPFKTGSEVVEALRDCQYSYSSTHLSKYLRKFSMSFQNISSHVYYLILALFPELHFYNPHRDIKSCIREYARLKIPLENEASCAAGRKLNLQKIALGHATRSELLEVSRLCPSTREISLNVELNAEETLNALEAFAQLTDFTLSYYPSFASSPPKLNGSVLLPLLMTYKNQIHGLNLTGFNISDKCLHELSQLPELKAFSLADCWMSNPKYISPDPFSSLEKLSLQFLPPNSTIHLLTSGKNLHSLSLDFVASEWEGNVLSDTHVKQLVTSGKINALQLFTVASPYLTLASVKSLTLLPSLRSIGHLARWGLTDEELHCINHSGPPHLICMQ